MNNSGNDILYMLGSIQSLEVSPAISPDGHLEWGSMRCGGGRRGAGEFGAGEQMAPVPQGGDRALSRICKYDVMEGGRIGMAVYELARIGSGGTALSFAEKSNQVVSCIR